MYYTPCWRESCHSNSGPTMRVTTVVHFILMALPSAHGFVRPLGRSGVRTRDTARIVVAAAGLPEGMEMPEVKGVFAEPGWPDLKVELNRVPTWCVANSDGSPAREVSSKGSPCWLI